MGRFGPLEIIVIAAVVLVLFGRGKISNLMGEVGKGITAFKRGVKDESAEAAAAAAAPANLPPPLPPSPAPGAAAPPRQNGRAPAQSSPSRCRHP